MDTHSLTSNTITKMVPPPLPPKPSHVSKPVLPPKPIKPVKRNTSLTQNSFIKQRTIETSTKAIVIDALATGTLTNIYAFAIPL